jgi:hypothetical protein
MQLWPTFFTLKGLCNAPPKAIRVALILRTKIRIGAVEIRAAWRAAPRSAVPRRPFDSDEKKPTHGDEAAHDFSGSAYLAQNDWQLTFGCDDSESMAKLLEYDFCFMFNCL